MLSFVINAVRVIQRSELKETRLMRGNVLIMPKGEAGWGGSTGLNLDANLRRRGFSLYLSFRWKFDRNIHFSLFRPNLSK